MSVWPYAQRAVAARSQPQRGEPVPDDRDRDRDREDAGPDAVPPSGGASSHAMLCPPGAGSDSGHGPVRVRTG